MPGGRISLFWKKSPVNAIVFGMMLMMTGCGGQKDSVADAGEEITPFIYEEASPFNEGIACVCVDGQYGYMGHGPLEGWEGQLISYTR